MQIKTGLTLILFTWMLATPVSGSANNFDDCRAFAREVSGYDAPVPSKYKRSGGALAGAVKGAAAGAALGWMTNSDKGDAAKKGAALGALFGALKKSKENKQRRENTEARERYVVALDRCMSQRER